MRQILITFYQSSCNKTAHSRKHLGLDETQHFTTAYVQVEQTQNMNCIFLSKVQR